MKILQDSLLNKRIASVSINYRFVNGTLHFEALMAQRKINWQLNFVIVIKRSGIFGKTNTRWLAQVRMRIARFATSSPLHNIGNVPTLLLHGTADAVVPIAHSQNLKIALEGKEISNKLVTFYGAGHDLGLGDAANLQKLVDEIDAWCMLHGR